MRWHRAASPPIHAARPTPAAFQTMIRFASALSVLALMAAGPLAAQQSARDFQLPPAPAPTQESRVQGPVDTEGVVPVRPRTIETARPTTPTPTPSPTASPTIVLPAAADPRGSAPARARPTPAPPTTARNVPTDVPTVPTPLAPIVQPTATAPATIPPSFPAASSPAPQVAAPVAAAEESTFPWLWIALGLLVAAGGAFFILRRRQAEPETPTILAPLAPAAAPAANMAAEALAISVEAVRMDRSVMNATVGYRVTLRNRTTQALSGLAIEADLVSASAGRPAESQLASPSQALTPRHTAERLAPGQSLRFEGQVRLPLAEASAIWQGRVGLLVPLLRVRATATGAEPVATTLVIGRSEGAAARPQPFRLDEPPRSYAPLAQRTLDAVPARA